MTDKMNAKMFALPLMAALMISAVPATLADHGEDGGYGYPTQDLNQTNSTYQGGEGWESEDENHYGGENGDRHEYEAEEEDGYGGEDLDDDKGYVNATSPASQGTYTASDVAAHGRNSDCWVVISGNVYDITSLVGLHGGGNVFDCGGDNTLLYKSRHGSSLGMMSGYLVGTLSGQTQVQSQTQLQVQQVQQVQTQQQTQLQQDQGNVAGTGQQAQTRQVTTSKNRFVEYEDAREQYVLAKQQGSANLHEKGKRLSEAADYIIISYTEDLKERIQNSTVFSTQTKERLIVGLDKELGTLNDLKGQVNSSKNMQQLRVLSNEMEREWNKIRVSLKQTVGETWVEQVKMAINASEQASDKVAAMVATYSGKDTSELQNLLGELNGHISSAIDSSQQAADVFGTMPSSDDSEVAFQMGRSLVNNAVQSIKDSRGTLREIVFELRGLDEDDDGDE